MTASAEDKPAEVYVYSTYHYCDFSKQERADEIFDQSQRLASEAAVKDGTISSYGWLAHQTGGQWRRADYFTAGSVQALLDAQKKMNPEGDDEIQEAHGGIRGDLQHSRRLHLATGGRQYRHHRSGYGRILDLLRLRPGARVPGRRDSSSRRSGRSSTSWLTDGKLKTWGWNEHIVGGEFRRLATLSATDMKALMEARGALVEALDSNPAGDMLTEICPSHADYMWEIKSQAP